jgi:hypothetical protein
MVKDLTRSLTKCHISDTQLFSIYRLHPYNFTLKNFPGLFRCIGVAEN